MSHQRVSIGCHSRGVVWQHSVLRRGLRRVLGKGSEKGACYGFCSKKGFLEGFSEEALRRGFLEVAYNAKSRSQIEGLMSGEVRLLLGRSGELPGTSGKVQGTAGFRVVKTVFWETVFLSPAKKGPGLFDEKWRKWRFAFHPEEQGALLLGPLKTTKMAGLTRAKPHPAAKGVRQKESGKKVDEKSDKSVRKSDRKVTESVPKTKKSDRTPFAALLLRHPENHRLPKSDRENPRTTPTKSTINIASAKLGVVRILPVS